MRCSFRSVILLLLLLMGWQGNVVAQPHTAEGVVPSVGCERDERPQWEDLGLEDLLVTVSQPSVSAPTTVRVVHEQGAALFRFAVACHRMFRSPSVAASTPHRASPGYLYLLLCLRL